jgi:hypothetical protein
VDECNSLPVALVVAAASLEAPAARAALEIDE